MIDEYDENLGHALDEEEIEMKRISIGFGLFFSCSLSLTVCLSSSLRLS